jgi:DtxR family Mn-dependent transcriptional regulator
MSYNGDFYTVRGYEILSKRKKLLTCSMEDYLEMIYRSSRKEGYTRTNILAEALNVQAPSATKMVQKLTKLGLLKYEKYGIIQLTEDGEILGEFLLKRHKIIEDFLKIIGVEENLLVNTELIEHNVTTGALSKIEMLNDFFISNPDILEKLKEYRKLHSLDDF